jgi:hypothetical protein
VSSIVADASPKIPPWKFPFTSDDVRLSVPVSRTQIPGVAVESRPFE